MSTLVSVDCSTGKTATRDLTDDERAARSQRARLYADAEWERAALAAQAIEDAKAAGVPDVLLAMIGWST